MFQPEIEIEHHERLLRIRALRQSGLIYREIAATLGISAARLSQLRPQVDRLPHGEPLLAMADVTLATELAFLPLSRRLRTILAASDFRTVGDLVAAGGKALRAEKLPGCDPRCLREIQGFLGALGTRGPTARADPQDERGGARFGVDVVPALGAV